MFHRSKLASIPAPGEAQFPCPPVGPERGAKSGELKPTHIEFAGEVFRRIKPARVAAPKRGEAETVIEADRDMCGERIPFAVDVAGPNPATVTLGTRVAGAMEAPRSNIRAVLK